MKNTFIGSGFVLDCIVALNLKFFSSCISRNCLHNSSFFHNKVHNHNWFHIRGTSKTAATTKMELFVTIVNDF